MENKHRFRTSHLISGQIVQKLIFTDITVIIFTAQVDVTYNFVVRFKNVFVMPASRNIEVEQNKLLL